MERRLFIANTLVYGGAAKYLVGHVESVRSYADKSDELSDEL